MENITPLELPVPEPAPADQPATVAVPAKRQRGAMIIGAAGAALVLIIGTAFAVFGHFALTTQASNQHVNDSSKTGCPSAIADPAHLSSPDITIQEVNANGVINAHPGNVLEVDLPAGFRWNLAAVDTTMMSTLAPDGYFDSGRNLCVWRFATLHAGMANLKFTRQPLCHTGLACPPLIITFAYAIQIA